MGKYVKTTYKSFSKMNEKYMNNIEISDLVYSKSKTYNESRAAQDVQPDDKSANEFIPNGNMKYKYSITYTILDEESAQEGEFAEQGFEIEPTVDTLETILSQASSFGIRGSQWSTPDSQTDFHTGEETLYQLFVTQEDDTELSPKMREFITNALNKGYTYYSEEYNEWN